MLVRTRPLLAPYVSTRNSRPTENNMNSDMIGPPESNIRNYDTLAPAIR